MKPGGHESFACKHCRPVKDMVREKRGDLIIIYYFHKNYNIYKNRYNKNMFLRYIVRG